jgi:hypothetical protein
MGGGGGIAQSENCEIALCSYYAEHSPLFDIHGVSGTTYTPFFRRSVVIILTKLFIVRSVEHTVVQNCPQRLDKRSLRVSMRRLISFHKISQT